MSTEIATMTAAEAEVWAAVQALNDAWAVRADADKLREYFHPEMVAITASDAQRLDGRDACIASWRAFVNLGKISSWSAFEPQVKLFNSGRCAIVTYYYELTVEVCGQVYDLRGRDMFTLVADDGRWLVVADHFSPYPRGGVE